MDKWHRSNSSLTYLEQSSGRKGADAGQVEGLQSRIECLLGGGGGYLKGDQMREPEKGVRSKRESL